MPLPNFTKELAEKIVIRALSDVADFSGTDLSSFTFRLFNDYHKKYFLISLKREVLKIKSEDRYYDIILNDDLYNQWGTIQDCAEYLFRHNALKTI